MDVDSVSEGETFETTVKSGPYSVHLTLMKQSEGFRVVKTGTEKVRKSVADVPFAGYIVGEAQEAMFSPARKYSYRNVFSVDEVRMMVN